MAAGARRITPRCYLVISSDIIQGMPKKSFTVRMEAEQLERLDRVRGLIPREAFVRQAIEVAIEQLEPSAKPRTQKGMKR